tara:strand:+ start:3467 stop:3790 length:324 start_codon:yes stop_codon:yes gene_type:complete
MAQFVKKENLTISIGEYEKDGQTKKQWRTIGEIISMIGDDGKPYQFFKLWGAGGVVEGKVFEQDNNNQGQNNNQQQNGIQQQYQQNQQQPQQGGYQAPQQQPQYQQR